MTPFKRKRRAAGLSQEELARQLGCNIKTVNSWEQGQTSPQPKWIPKLAKIFKITPDETTHLFDEPEPAAA